MEKEEQKTPAPGGHSMAEWIAAGAIILIVLLCLAFCSGRSNSGNSLSNSDSAALVACKRYAKQQFPYGFEYSTLDANITEINGRTRVTFYDAKIGNAYGAQRTSTVHCDVAGGSIVGFDAS